MGFSDAVRFAVRGPNRWVNIGCLLVCMLIPIVGPMVASGYLIVVEKLLIRYPEAEAPRFDFGQFSMYLRRSSGIRRWFTTSTDLPRHSLIWLTSRPGSNPISVTTSNCAPATWIKPLPRRTESSKILSALRRRSTCRWNRM